MKGVNSFIAEFNNVCISYICAKKKKISNIDHKSLCSNTHLFI